MTKITSFDRKAAQKILDLAAVELNKKLADFGINVNVGSGRFTDSELTGKLVFTLTEAGPKQLNALDVAMSGLPKDVIGKRFLSGNGDMFVVTDYKPRRPKFPVTGKRVSDGKMFKFPVEAVKKSLIS